MKAVAKIFIPVFFIMLTLSCGQADKTVAPEEVGMSADSLKSASLKMQEYIEEGTYAGIAVRTVKEGVRVQDERFGYADVEEGKALGDDAIYRIFSMSKPITAVALMTLYEDGLFTLDDRVADYIPEFSETMVYTPEGSGFTLEPQENEMTIRHLLTHTSGLTYGWQPGSYVDSLYNVHGVSGWDAPLEEKVKLLATIPLKWQPGTRWEYGLSIDVAGYLIELLSGMPFDEYLAAEVFEPLGMDDTGFHVPEEKHSRFTSLYTRDEAGQVVELRGMAGLSKDDDADDIFKKPAVLFSGGGGLVSTMDDYEKFCRMMLNGGELNGTGILDEETVDLIMSDQLPAAVEYKKAYGYGLGGQVEEETGTYSWSGAASTSFAIDPSQKLIMLTFTQLMPSDYSYAILYKDIVRSGIVRD